MHERGSESRGNAHLLPGPLHDPTHRSNYVCREGGVLFEGVVTLHSFHRIYDELHLLQVLVQT